MLEMRMVSTKIEFPKWIRESSVWRVSSGATLLVCLVTWVAAGTATAIPITVPTGLNPGDEYRLAFVTSTTRDATSSDITVYNGFVTASANAVTELALLGSTWTAIASTPTADARDNTNTNPSAC
jgi:hypothetical protein